MLIRKKMLLLVLLCLSGALSGVDAANRSKLGEFSIILSPVTPAPSTSSSPPTLSLVQSNAIRDTTEVILEAYIESRFSNRPELTELSMLRLGSGGPIVLEEEKKQAPFQLSSFYSLTMTFTGLIYYTDSTVLIPSDDEIAEYVVEALSQPYLMEVLQADPTLSSLFSDAPPSLWVDHPLVVISSSPSTTPPTENDKEEDTNNNKGLPGLAKVQETPESDSDNSSLNMAAVIGGVVGGIVIVALGAIALVFSNRRRVTDDMTTLEHHHHHRQHTSSSSGDHEHTATDLAAYDVQKIQPESSSASLDRTFDADDDEDDIPCSPEDEGDDDTKEAHPSPPPPSSLPSSRLASLVAAAAASFPSSTTSRRGGKSSSIIEAHNATSISSSVGQTSGDGGNDSPPASSQAARAAKSASLVATSSSHSHHDDQGWDDDAATASSFSSEALRQIQPHLVVPIPSMESFEEQPSRYTLKKDMMMLEGGWSSSLATPKDPTDTSKESSCVLSPTDMSAAGLSGRTSPYQIPEDRLYEDEDVDAVKNRNTKASPSNPDFRNFAKERFFPKPARSSAAKSWWRTPKQDDSHNDDANQGSEADSTTLGDPSDLHMWDPDDDKHSVDDGDGAESEVFSETTLPNQDHHQLLSTAVRRESFKLQRLRTPPPKTPKDSDFDSRTNKTDLDPSRFVEL